MDEEYLETILDQANGTIGTVYLQAGIDIDKNNCKYIVTEAKEVTILESFGGKARKCIFRQEFLNYYKAEQEFNMRTSVIGQLLRKEHGDDYLI